MIEGGQAWVPPAMLAADIAAGELSRQAYFRLAICIWCAEPNQEATGYCGSNCFRLLEGKFVHCSFFRVRPAFHASL